jgi:hypothetical protein
MDIIGLISFGILFSLFVTFLIISIFSRIKIIKLQNIISQLRVDNLLLINETAIQFNKLQVKELEQTDGFLKFIEQSRDWAFQYIEEMQSAFLKFDKEISSIQQWNETYGTVTDGGVYSEKIKQISLAYNQLKDLLPKDTETPNN